MAGNIASINIKFVADLAQFSTKMQNANRSIIKAGKSMQKVGAGLTLGVTGPLLALGVAGVVAWDKQAKAVAQVEAGLRSTGAAVGYTSEQLQKMSSDLQNNTLFGDDDILKDVTAQLLTFTNIAGTAFERTQVAALDLATRLDGDLKSATIQLGKALNDPVANLSALSRSGIQFSTEQKAVIKSLVDTNRLADAQTIILDELEKQYGGSAAAAAKAGTGPLKQLGNILGDLSEDFGAIIAEAILPFVAKLKDLALRFKELSEPTKKWIAITAGIAAALGPVLVTLGFLTTTVLPGLITIFGALKVATLASAGAFRTLTVAMLANPIALLVAGIAAVTVGFTAMIQKITPLVSKLQTFFNMIKSGGNSVRFINLQMESQAEAMIEAAEAAKIAAAAQKVENKATEDYNKDLQKTLDLLKEVDIAKTRKAATSIEAPDAVNSYDLNARALASGRGVGSVDIINPDDIKAPIAEVDEELIAFESRLLDFQGQTAEIMSGAAGGFIEGFAGIAGAIVQGNASIGSVFSLLYNILGDVAIQIGKAAISIGLAMNAVKLSFSNPFTAIAAGAALILVGTLMKGLATSFSGGSTPALASGGLAFGPTLAVVGDNVGAASDPEVIAPLSKLKDYLTPASGTSEMQLTGQFKLSGRDLDLVVQRTVNELNRVR